MSCLLAQFSALNPDHNYCAMKSSEISSASAFTLFINNGGLKIPSESVYKIIEYAEKVFKSFVCKHGSQISTEKNIKQRMILNVCNYFIMNSSHRVFEDHETVLVKGDLEEEHRSKLIKLTAERYFKLRFFTYGKRYNKSVVAKGQQSDRHHLTKLILFKNQ